LHDVSAIRATQKKILASAVDVNYLHFVSVQPPSMEEALAGLRRAVEADARAAELRLFGMLEAAILLLIASLVARLEAMIRDWREGRLPALTPPRIRLPRTRIRRRRATRHHSRRRRTSRHHGRVNARRLVTPRRPCAPARRARPRRRARIPPPSLLRAARAPPMANAAWLSPPLSGAA
jgi:hypothetical protein